MFPVVHNQPPHPHQDKDPNCFLKLGKKVKDDLIKTISHLINSPAVYVHCTTHRLQVKFLGSLTLIVNKLPALTGYLPPSRASSTG